MLTTEQKPIEEILKYLERDKGIFIVGCRGCAEGCHTGGEQEVLDVKQKLGDAGKTVTGTSLIDFMCNENLVRMTLQAQEAKIVDADSLIVLCCGIGVQATSAVVDKIVHPGCNTVSMGGRHGEWRDGERCLECGNCVLEFTGGICPIARCAKSLLHGPCGGSEGGKCEVHPDLPCAWDLIIQRLTKLGKLDILEDIIPPKNWGVSLTGGPPRPR
jgi:Methylene-tetrahydrofolate reductase C terminal